MYWSVDTNGDVFRSHGGADEDPCLHMVVDSDGVEWTVHEVATPQAWARGDHCLVLSSRECVRRIWNYPSDWRRLDADALLALGVMLGDRAVETRSTSEP